jgi:transcriptional regulator with XRE-family HTH domain
MPLNDLPKRINQRRKMQGLTQSQLAERVGITQAFLAEIEKGRKRPSLDVLEKLCDALGCSADYLLGIPPNRQYKVLQEDQPQSSLLNRGITAEMLDEITARNISPDELRLAIKLAQTLKDEGHKD